MIWLLAAVVLAATAWFTLGIPALRERRRARWRREGLSGTARDLLWSGVPWWKTLPPELRARAEGHARVLLEEKDFLAADGLDWDDAMAAIVAGHGGLMLAGWDRPRYFPRLDTIWLVPEEFRGRHVDDAGGGMLVETEEERSGESWETGIIILSWPDIRTDLRYPEDGFNVIFHELAHQLDLEFDLSGGHPRLPEPLASRLAEVLASTFEELQHRLPRSRQPALDDYAATDPVELWAVANETYFMQPHRLQREHPELHDAMRAFYGVVPD